MTAIALWPGGAVICGSSTEDCYGLEQVGDNLLIVGRIRDSSTFAAGQRSEIGRYEVPTEVSLPGFDIGMIN